MASNTMDPAWFFTWGVGESEAYGLLVDRKCGDTLHASVREGCDVNEVVQIFHMLTQERNRLEVRDFLTPGEFQRRIEILRSDPEVMAHALVGVEIELQYSYEEPVPVGFQVMLERSEVISHPYRLTVSPLDRQSKNNLLRLPSSLLGEYDWRIPDGVRTASLSPREAGELYFSLNALRINAMPPDRSGLDGETKYLRIVAGNNAVEYSMWCADEGWSELDAFFDFLLAKVGCIPFARS